jgi:demethylmenaquinone methyltransferase/2-methoxy-6-polyprenyl-1,4-benzoquinol methylase
MEPAMKPRETGEPLPPHTPLRNYYAEDEERSRYVQDLFNRTARYYNTIEGIFLNIGLWYRRFSLQRNGLKPGMKVLDVAIGTAAVARGAARIVGSTGRVYGVDPNRAMMGEARKNFAGPLTQGVAQQLPFKSDTFDFVTMGIALRHVPDLVATFKEYLRVLKPGGQLWILESHVPRSKLGHQLSKLLWAKFVPGLTFLSTGSRDAKLLMDYYWDTIEKCVQPEVIHAALEEAGFANARFSVVVPGSFCEYTGTKR